MVAYSKARTPEDACRRKNRGRVFNDSAILVFNDSAILVFNDSVQKDQAYVLRILHMPAMSRILVKPRSQFLLAHILVHMVTLTVTRMLAYVFIQMTINMHVSIHVYTDDHKHDEFVACVFVEKTVYRDIEADMDRHNHGT